MRNRAVCGALFAAWLCAPSAVSAADSVTPAAAPWIAAAGLLRDTEADIKKGGVPTVKNHVQDLENAFAEISKIFPLPPAADGSITLLTDGAAETRAARADAALRHQTVVAVADNPYPRLALYLGTYYNDGGRPRDALRIMYLAFKLTSGDRNLGAHLPELYGEIGFSQEILKHWTDALQICQAGLALSDMDRPERARLYRCAGYSYSELGRFAEAETAYRAAIRLEPGNKIAPLELEFVLHNKAASEATPP